MANPESTVDLLARAKAGDDLAFNRLFERYLPILRRWARGRLPQYARDMEDTEDLVQDTIFQTLRHLEGFEYRHEGALQAYLRQAIVNRIRDLVRRAGRHPVVEGLEAEQHVTSAASPLEEAIGREALDRYEAALDRLRPEEREAVIARVELGLSFNEVADALGKPSADAARMAVARALLRLAAEMKHR